MKPIFEEERKLLNRHFPMEIVGEFYWRDKNNIYMNCDDKKPICKIEIDMKDIGDGISLNFNKNLMDYRKQIKNKNYTWEEEYEKRKDIIETKFRKSVEMAKKWILKYYNTDREFVVSISGGKDSDLMKYVVDAAYEELGLEKNYRLIGFNTTNEAPDTYKYLKQVHGFTKDNFISPEVGWHQVIKNKDYYIPTTLSRYCCDIFKEKQMAKLYSPTDKVLIFLGMRQDESHKRSFYDYDLNKAWVKHYSKLPKSKRKPLNVPETWERFLPIVEWLDEEVWLFITHNNLKFNPMYKKGFDRVG